MIKPENSSKNPKVSLTVPKNVQQARKPYRFLAYPRGGFAKNFDHSGLADPLSAMPSNVSD